MIRRIISLFLTALAAGVIIVGTHYAQEALTYRWQGYTWYSDHIAFDYDTLLGDSVTLDWQPASTETDVPGGAMPEETIIGFESYDEATQTFIQNNTTLRVFPLFTLPGTGQPIDTLVASLRQLLAMTDAEFASYVQRGDPLPAVYQLTANQIITAQVNRDLEGSTRGLRYLTVAAQDASPIVNGQLYYLYVGFDDAETSLIEFSSAVSTDLLPNNYPEITDWDAFAATYTDYLATLDQNLEAADEASFTPSLATLDAFSSSIVITTPNDGMFLAGSSISDEGFSMPVDWSLATRVERDIVPPITGEEAANSLFGELPGLVRYTLVGYPLYMRYVAPEILVYNTADFAGTSIEPNLQALKDLLTAKPELREATIGDMGYGLPVLPPIHAGQIFILDPHYVRFAGGEGVAFITSYSQNFAPITSGSIFYVMQGLSADGTKAVSLIFPLGSNALGTDEQDYSLPENKDFNDYVTEVFNLIKATPLYPNVSQLEAMIAGIQFRN